MWPGGVASVQIDEISTVSSSESAIASGRRRSLCCRFETQLVQSVEGGDLIALGHGRIVEDRVAEVVDRAAERHHRLPDVYDFGRGFADAMHTEELSRVPVEQQLQQSRLIADDLPAGDLPESGDSDFIRHTVFCEFAARSCRPSKFRES